MTKTPSTNAGTPPARHARRLLRTAAIVTLLLAVSTTVFSDAAGADLVNPKGLVVSESAAVCRTDNRSISLSTWVRTLDDVDNAHRARVGWWITDTRTGQGTWRNTGWYNVVNYPGRNYTVSFTSATSAVYRITAYVEWWRPSTGYTGWIMDPNVRVDNHYGNWSSTVVPLGGYTPGSNSPVGRSVRYDGICQV